MLAKAIALASTLFVDTYDKGGHPYILHCLRVWRGVRHCDIDTQVAAILHDVVEDTDYTYEMLIEEGFSLETVRILQLLTHDKKNVPYMEYITDIAHCEKATEIKKSDLRDNSDITRLKGVTKKDLDRVIKYNQAYMFLSKT